MSHRVDPVQQVEVLAPIHAPGLFEALDDPRVGTFIGGPDVTTLDALRERIRLLGEGAPSGSGETWLNWAVIADGVVVGRLEATLHDGFAEIAYVFGPRWWGRGHATVGVRWMLDALRTSWGISEWWATVDPRNTASAGVLGRCGFVEAEQPAVGLHSFDDGDLVFVRR